MLDKVVVGLSGGVDSAVAAYLLKKQGYEVIGVTMQIMSNNCGNPLIRKTNEKTIKDASKVAAQIGIEHVVVDKSEDFNKLVVSYFIQYYNKGKTPNPCIKCNPLIKWDVLIQIADEMGARYIATGHYANIVKLTNGRYTIANAKSVEKDQTYALFNLRQDQLERTILPLGNYEKSTVRDIALKAGIEVAEKKDSQDICFIPDGRYANFIWRHTGKRAIPGNIVLEDGTIMGRHKGIIFYTVGQRRGLSVNIGVKLFVKELRADTNEVVISPIEEIYTSKVEAVNINFMGMENLEGEIKAFAKIRYSHEGGECVVRILDEDRVQCVFDKPQRAITPGQGLVVYDTNGNILLGGEII